MCGRLTQALRWREIVRLYGMPGEGGPALARWKQRWNGAPAQSFAVCREGESGRELALMRWGLVPSWARDRAIGSRLINARSETVVVKPAFRAAYRRRRCLVPVNGWFEWHRGAGGNKQPFSLALAGGEPFSLAGLWEAWGEGEGRLETFTILTCPAAAALAHVHGRQPAVLSPAAAEAWLDAATSPAERLNLVQAAHGGPYAVRAVSTLVNSARNDGPEVLREVGVV